MSGCSGADVGDVADVALEECEPAGGVDGLEDDWRAGAQRFECGFEQPCEIRRLEMLDDLRREQPAERSSRHAAQIGERVGLRRLEPLLAAYATIASLRSMPRAVMPLLAQQRQELAAAAADVEDVGRAGEDREVVAQLPLNVLARPAKRIFEADVLVAERLDAGRSSVRRLVGPA